MPNKRKVNNENKHTHFIRTQKVNNENNFFLILYDRKN